MWMWVLHWWCRKHRSGRMSSAHWMAHGRTSIRWENIKCRTNKMPMYVESFYVCAIQNCGSLAFTLHTKWNKRRTTRSVLIVKHEKRKRERKMGKKKEKAKIHRNPTTSTYTHTNTNTYTVETKQRKIVLLDPLAYTWLWAHIRLLHRIALYVSVVLAHGIHFMC